CALPISSQVRIAQVRTSQVRTSQIRTGQVCAAQARKVGLNCVLGSFSGANELSCESVLNFDHGVRPYWSRRMTVTVHVSTLPLLVVMSTSHSIDSHASPLTDSTRHTRLIRSARACSIRWLMFMWFQSVARFPLKLADIK